MRVFSIMGAYALITNNELLHFGMFIVMNLMYWQTAEDLLVQPEDQCFLDLERQAYQLKAMHIIAAILLASPRIYYGCFKRQGQQKKEVKNKIWVSVKFNEDPIFFDILNLVVLVLYMGFLVAAS
jgi:hypothetical protein